MLNRPTSIGNVLPENASNQGHVQHHVHIDLPSPGVAGRIENGFLTANMAKFIVFKAKTPVTDAAHMLIPTIERYPEKLYADINSRIQLAAGDIVLMYGQATAGGPQTLAWRSFIFPDHWSALPASQLLATVSRLWILYSESFPTTVVKTANTRVATITQEQYNTFAQNISESFKQNVDKILKYNTAQAQRMRKPDDAPISAENPAAQDSAENPAAQDLAEQPAAKKPRLDESKQ
jgi:hypothetical protein